MPGPSLPKSAVSWPDTLSSPLGFAPSMSVSSTLKMPGLFKAGSSSGAAILRVSSAVALSPSASV